MRSDPKLDSLESEVLSRIAAHRQAQKSFYALPVALVVVLTALASGWLTGIEKPRHLSVARGSEAVLLADDVSLAPSSLLASNR